MRNAVLTDSASFSQHQGNSHTQQATSPYEYTCQIMRHIVLSRVMAGIGVLCIFA